MSREEEWIEFSNGLLKCEIERLKDTQEYKQQHQRREAIDEMLTTNLSESQKTLVDECLFELGLAAERESEIFYQQGLKDGVWLLKNMGVLA